MANKKAKDNQEKINVLDLFSGCGGLSVGFQAENFNIVAGIDNWPDAIKTFEYNHKNAIGICDDIKKISGKEIIKKSGVNKIDIIIGGPPCQSFSLAGSRNIVDNRNNLPFEFIRLTKELKPRFFLLENVLGILSMKKGSVKKEIIKGFEKIGYNVDVKDLYSHNYGVPQKRRRVFFFGNRLNLPIEFPKITHSENIKQDRLQKIITVGDAISDLEGLETEDNAPIKYAKKARSDYQKAMRKGSKKITNHQKSNHTKQTKKIIGLVPEGGNWKDLPKKYQNVRSYSNTWKRLSRNEPSVTIDTGHRHHFHYKANRVPTVRESARIQSFPDKFIFLGTKTSQFKQVGNAMPPLLSKAFARKIKELLKKNG